MRQRELKNFIMYAARGRSDEKDEVNELKKHKAEESQIKTRSRVGELFSLVTVRSASPSNALQEKRVGRSAWFKKCFVSFAADS